MNLYITDMKVYTEIYDLREFTPWQGAVNTWQTICDKGLGEQFIQAFEDVCADGSVADIELNDFLWFQPEEAYKLVGLTESGEEPE